MENHGQFKEKTISFYMMIISALFLLLFIYMNLFISKTFDWEDAFYLALPVAFFGIIRVGENEEHKKYFVFSIICVVLYTFLTAYILWRFILFSFSWDGHGYLDEEALRLSVVWL